MHDRQGEIEIYRSYCDLKQEVRMKRKDILPTSQERLMRENDFIVSKTDLTGRITYANEIFIEFAGYCEEELLGTQHNIVRHPDMPRAVFHLFWDYLSKDREIFAYVKNMSKDGGYYWVFAQVAPMKDANNKKIGYTSVRRMPNPKAIPIVAEIYRSMLEAERKAGTRDAIAASDAVLGAVLKDKGVSYEELINVLQAL
jgi:PAS domain S-box-containing protein